MPAQNTILANLRRTQSFDADLRSMDDIDRIADEFAEQLLYQPDSGKRKPKIEQLVERLVTVAEKRVLPQAEKIGQANATDLIKVTPQPKGVNLNDPQERANALLNGRRRTADRLAIIRESIKANGVDLDASLTRYWLEPAEGKEKEKLARLRQIHERMERERKAWETAMRAFHNGESTSRPKKPNLDYLSALTTESKSEIRQQARRAGTDAEIAVFTARGHKYFVWITPNGAAACPDCQNRQNAVLTMPEWERIGRPGSGQTVCNTHCFCMLVPLETASVTPQLLSTAPLKTPGPLTTQADLAVLNANRIGAPKTPAAPVATKAPPPAPAKPTFTAEQLAIPITEHTPVSAAFKGEVQKALNSVPDAWRAKLKEKGAEINISKFLTDARPDLKGVQPRGWSEGSTWDQAAGMATFNRAYVSELRYSVGTFKVEVSAGNVQGTLRHELGHVADSLFNYVSSQREFREIYDKESDILRKTSVDSQTLSYFIQTGNSGRDGASEAFAEGFGILTGGGSGNSFIQSTFKERFSQTLSKIEDIMNRVTK
jgi:hypothetical protein